MKKNLKSKLHLIKDVLFATSPMDGLSFLNEWEDKYSTWHDPLPEEVTQRLSCFKPQGNFFKGVVVCEIGAGYGRIISLLPDDFTKIGIEPDKLLFHELSRIEGVSAYNLKADKLPSNLHIDIFYSVRALDYVNLCDATQMLKRLKQSYPKAIFLAWERKPTAIRLRFCRKIVGFKGLYIQEIVN